MNKSLGYLWAILFLLLILIVDAYYQISESTVPIWETSWFWWRIAGAGAIILILAFYYSYRRSRLIKSSLEEFKVKLMQSQEEEWKRLAGELHDSVGQNLSAINIYLQQNIKSLNAGPDIQENLRAASEMLVETIDDVRRISTKLYPQQIERLGLTVAIQSMVTKLNTTTPIRFILQSDNIDSLFAKETEVYFYRIIQEALNNIIKHSHAKRANIIIKKAVLFINVDIDDDGKGFDMEKLISGNSSKLGFGMLNLDERIRLVKGTYKYSSEEGKGTRLHITIPIKAK